MADVQIFANGAAGYLQTGISNSATSITLQPGQGQVFPGLAAGQFYVVVLEVEGSYEIVRVKGRAGDVLSVIRGQEGTVPMAFPAGALVEMRVTAGTMTYIRNLISATKGETGPYKDPVLAATLTNINLVGLQTIDNVTLNVGDRVLVKNQTNPAQNGIYIAQTGMWTRTTDFDDWSKAVAAVVIVDKGIVQSDTVWFCNASINAGILDTDNLSFFQLAGKGTYKAGSGVTIGADNSIGLADGSNAKGLNAASGLGFVALTGSGAVAVRTLKGATGRISVGVGNGFDSDPVIDLADRGLTAGVYTKVGVDKYGTISSVANLGPADLPTSMAADPTRGDDSLKIATTHFVQMTATDQAIVFAIALGG